MKSETSSQGSSPLFNGG
jgi:hypothetical protein